MTARVKHTGVTFLMETKRFQLDEQRSSIYKIVS